MLSNIEKAIQKAHQNLTIKWALETVSLFTHMAIFGLCMLDFGGVPFSAKGMMNKKV